MTKFQRSFFISIIFFLISLQIAISENYRQIVVQLEQQISETKGLPEKVSSLHQLGEIYYQFLHNYPKAIQTFDRIISLDHSRISSEDLFLAYIKKGNTYCRIGQYENAIETYQKLVEISPADHFARHVAIQKIHDIRYSLDQLQQLQQTIIDYENSPIAIEAKLQIIELYRKEDQLNQPHKAISLGKALLADHPKSQISPEIQWRIGELYRKTLRRSDLAIDAFTKVYQNYPNSNFVADAHFQIAIINYKLKHFDKSIKHFDLVLTTFPNFWKTYATVYWRAMAHEKIGNFRQAVTDLRVFTNVYLPKINSAYFGELGRYDRTRDQIRSDVQSKISQLEKDLPNLEWEQIETLIDQKNYILALKISQQLIADFPDHSNSRLAANQLKPLQHHAMIQNLRNHNTARSLLQIGKIYERELKHYDLAIDAFTHLAEDFPDSPCASEAIYRMATIYTFHKKHLPKAIGLYQKLIDECPTCPQTMMANFQLAEIYRQTKRSHLALKAYQTTIAFPERPLYLADGYTDSFADRAFFRIGRIYFEDRRFDRAEKAFREFVQNRPRSPRLAAAFVYLGKIYKDQKREITATATYNKAIQLISESRVQAEMIASEIDDFPHDLKRIGDLIRWIETKQK